MKPIIRVLTLTLPALLMTQATTAAANDPQAIYERCVNQVAQLVQRCEAVHRQTVEECLPQIRILLDQNKFQEARVLAGRCIEYINQTSRLCSAEIRFKCRRCYEILVQLGATQLANQLNYVCERALLAVEESRLRSIRQILAPF